MLFAEWNSESLTAFFGGIAMIITGLTSTYIALKKRKGEDKKMEVAVSGTDARAKQKLQHDHIDKVIEKWEGLYTEMQEREKNCQMELSALRTDYTELSRSHMNLREDHESTHQDLMALRREVQTLKEKPGS